MSRTFNEHHPVTHNPKNRVPAPYLNEGGVIKKRRRKMRVCNTNYEEVYSQKFGEIFINRINKSKFKRLIKKQIREELENSLY